MSTGNVVISSEYVELSEKFYGKTIKKTVLVYVEGDPDVRFWSPFFRKFKDDYDITVQRAFEISSQDGKQANGCSRISSLIKSGQIVLGPHLFTCIDSDYRFILDDYSGYEFAEDSPYAFETRVCAKENVSSTCDGVQDLIEQASSLTKWFSNFSVEWFFNTLSKSIYINQMLYLFYMRSDKVSAKKLRVSINSCIINFEKWFKKLNYNSVDNEILKTKLREFRKQMHSIFKANLQESNQNEFLTFSLSLRRGKNMLSSDTLYFMRGHDFYDLIFYPVVSHLAHTIVMDEKEKRIANGDQDGANQLFKIQIPTKNLLESRRDIDKCKFFNFTIKKIENTLTT